VTADDVRRLAPILPPTISRSQLMNPNRAMPIRQHGQRLDDGRARTWRTIDAGMPGHRIKTAGGRVTGVETNRGEFDAPVVVNAAGAWAGAVGRMAGVELPVDAWWHEVAFIRRPPRMRAHQR